MQRKYIPSPYNVFYSWGKYQKHEVGSVLLVQDNVHAKKCELVHDSESLWEYWEILNRVEVWYNKNMIGMKAMSWDTKGPIMKMVIWQREKAQCCKDKKYRFQKYIFISIIFYWM